MAAKKYSHSTNIMISEPVADLVADLADRESLSKAQVMRSLLHAGIRKAGYGYVLDGTDARPNPTAALGPEVVQHDRNGNAIRADSVPTAP